MADLDDTLSGAAGRLRADLDVTPEPVALAAVHGRGAARRRRRQAVIGSAAAVALGAVAIALVAGGAGPGTLEAGQAGPGGAPGSSAASAGAPDSTMATGTVIPNPPADVDPGEPGPTLPEGTEPPVDPVTSTTLRTSTSVSVSPSTSGPTTSLPTSPSSFPTSTPVPPTTYPVTTTTRPPVAPPYVTVESARARWAATRPANYELVVRRGCFCPVDAIGPYKVRVEGTTIVSIEHTITRVHLTPAQIDQYRDLTIDAMFDAAERALEHGTGSINWPTGSSFPVNISTDPEPMMADEEMSWQIESLTAV